MNSIQISVIMPTYNAMKWLDKAVDSILQQTFHQFELIIIDDASIDDSPRILLALQQKDSRIKVITNQVNQGVSISRNQGISIAQGQYIACMDSDDWSYPSRLEQQIDFMRKNPSVVICGTFIEICDENLEKLNNRIYPCTDRDIRRKLFRYSPFAHPSTMCRADVLKKVGGYDKELVAVEDYDLYFKMGKYGKFANIAKTLHKLRFSAQSLSQVKGRLIETTTLNVRMKAVNDYHYQMTYADRAYFYLQKFSMYLIPYRIKFYLFNWLRSL